MTYHGKAVTSTIAVIGLGKIGLPLAVQFAAQGYGVIGLDVNSYSVELINSGQTPFPGEAQLDELLPSVIASRRLRATVEAEAAIRTATTVVVVVPMYVDYNGQPEYSHLDAATLAIGRYMQSGTLVCYETTVPVGTTRGRFKAMLEEASGFVCGRDFNLAFSPERVSSGRVFADLRRYPKLVGGVTPQCGERARQFYESVLEFDERPDLPKPNGVWDLGSCEASELAKLAETTYRDVNIALANQFAKFSSKHGIDIHSVIEACNSQPFSHIHQPGIAVGGHCIPVYPQMYLWNDPDASVVRAGRLTNASMPEHYIAALEKEHGSLKGETVLVLGAAYRGGVKETAFSGVFPVVEALHSRGALCYVTDPLYTANELDALGLPTKGNASEVTAVVIQADHAEYLTYDFLQHPNLRSIVNGRNLPLKSTSTRFIK
jgi:nucleotide sugar dehydrogenase